MAFDAQNPRTCPSLEDLLECRPIGSDDWLAPHNAAPRIRIG